MVRSLAKQPAPLPTFIVSGVVSPERLWIHFDSPAKRKRKLNAFKIGNADFSCQSELRNTEKFASCRSRVCKAFSGAVCGRWALAGLTARRGNAFFGIKAAMHSQ
jgi:hypothetical protein